jgi:hypothetical protein
MPRASCFSYSIYLAEKTLFNNKRKVLSLSLSLNNVGTEQRSMALQYT